MEAAARFTPSVGPMEKACKTSVYSVGISAGPVQLTPMASSSAYPNTSSGDTHGAVWSNGTIADLGTLEGGGLFSDAEGINNQGVVAGVVARRTASPSTPSSGR